MSDRLSGKVALVTGGRSGIGRALVRGLAGEGAVVHIADLRESGDVLAELANAPRGKSFTCDISQVDQVNELFSSLERLDILVNCAGITGWTDVHEPDEETWDAVIDTNLKGTFFCSIAAARLMRLRGSGSIINVSTVVATRALRNLAAYAASKGGINALTIQLAGELASDGIRVNAFAPGPTNTERNLTDDPRYAVSWSPLIPLGRIAEPEDMVGVAVFLASDESAYVTGQLLCVDGGWTVAGKFPDAYVDAAARKNARQTAADQRRGQNR